MKKPINNNYCANVVKVSNIVELENCDNVQHAIILGNKIVVSKEVKINDIGLFFPVETKLSHEFLSNNNLYRHNELNIDKNKKGYFEDNGRIRCVKFRGNKSEGFFIPIESLNFTNHNEKLKLNDEFDEINNIKICEKYVIERNNLKSQNRNNKQNKKIKRFNRLIDNQFRFHIDTSQLYKNMHMLKPESLISITSKLHGTSLISSNILVKRKLNTFEKILKKLGIKINEFEYDYIYSSRKVVKNQYINKEVNHYYKKDIWEEGHKILKPFLQKGMTIYAEIVGYIDNVKMIQKNYDYGCKPNEFKVYIYRITYTNFDGKVFEWSMKQIQDWCKENRLNAVPLLYYGYIKDLYNLFYNEEQWNDNFLEFLKQKYLEGDCIYCNNKVPFEGIVLRLESLDIEVFKLKSERFYLQETKQLDSGERNIEDEESLC